MLISHQGCQKFESMQTNGQTKRSRVETAVLISGVNMDQFTRTLGLRAVQAVCAMPPATGWCQSHVLVRVFEFDESSKADLDSADKVD